MKTDDLQLVKVEGPNIAIFHNLGQAYEAEFSRLTHKMPDASGLFAIDTLPYAPYTAYLLYCENIPIGFCVVNVESEIKDFAEFYIVPVMRKKNMGYQLAMLIFNQHPGHWQARQIQSAIEATEFWRHAIKKYTHNNYQEAVVEDVEWGTVIRQCFYVPAS